MNMKILVKYFLYIINNIINFIFKKLNFKNSAKNFFDCLLKTMYLDHNN